jgi:ADP-ribose pyrophosphatase YjhB (NUDIX family)
MAHPHPTPDLPGRWPKIRAEVERVHLADSESAALLRALDGDGCAVAGHVCATTWILSPDGAHTILVRHRTFGWSVPGGHIEPNESTFEGGLRELEEETGLTRYDVRPVLEGPALVHVTDLVGERPHRHWNVGWLWTCDRDAPLSPGEGARWFSVDSVPDGPPGLVSDVTRLAALVARTRAIG